jgi:hypothetical protein
MTAAGCSCGRCADVVQQIRCFFVSTDCFLRAYNSLPLKDLAGGSLFFYGGCEVAFGASASSDELVPQHP